MRRHFSKILLADIVDSLKVAPALYNVWLGEVGDEMTHNSFTKLMVLIDVFTRSVEEPHQTAQFTRSNQITPFIFMSYIMCCSVCRRMVGARRSYSVQKCELGLLPSLITPEMKGR